MDEQGVQGEDVAFYKVNALAQADASGVIRDAWDTISVLTARRLRAPLLPPGSIVLAKIGAALLLGRVRRTDRLSTIDSNMLAVIPLAGVDPAYLTYAMHTFDWEVLANPGAVPSLDMGAFRRYPMCFPPLDEQRAIADYLDRETARIDAFIAKNEELMALLTERRAAATFRLVTGLGQGDADSRTVQADWFQVVPRSWDVAPLYTMAQTFAGGTPKSDTNEYWSDSDDGVEWISIGDMRTVHAGSAHSGRRVTSAGMEAAGLAPRTGPLVLFAMYASVGEVAMLRRRAVWNQAILGIQTNPARLNERYLYWVLLALRPRLGIYFRSNTQDNLNAAQVRSLRIPVPPLHEQSTIADELEEIWASVDRAIANAQRGVDLARERRAALISAAVTGKIDVGVVA